MQRQSDRAGRKRYSEGEGETERVGRKGGKQRNRETKADRETKTDRQTEKERSGRQR